MAIFNVPLFIQPNLPELLVHPMLSTRDTDANSPFLRFYPGQMQRIHVQLRKFSWNWWVSREEAGIPHLWFGTWD